MAESKTLGAKQVATRIGTDAKTFRKFMRAHQAGVGQGRRYDFPEADVPEIAKEFKKWLANSKAPKTQAERPVPSAAAKRGPRRPAAKMIDEVEDPKHTIKPMTLHGSGPSLKIVHSKPEPEPSGLDEFIDDSENEEFVDELEEDEELQDLVDEELIEEDEEEYDPANDSMEDDEEDDNE